MSDMLLYDWARPGSTMRLPDSSAPTNLSFQQQGFSGVSGPAPGTPAAPTATPTPTPAPTPPPVNVKPPPILLAPGQGNSMTRDANGNLVFNPASQPQVDPASGFNSGARGTGPLFGGGAPAPGQSPPPNPVMRPRRNPDGTLSFPTGTSTGQWPYAGGGPPTNFSPTGYPNPWGTTAQGGNENRTFATSGLDPRLDSAFQYALGQAFARYQDPNGMNFFNGQPTVANLTPDELAAQNLMRGMAFDPNGVQNSGQGYYNTALARAANPGSDPTIDQAVAAMRNDTLQSATDPGGIYQQIRQGALDNGTLGSSRQGIAEGVASGRIAQAIASQAAKLRLDARGQDIQAGSSAFGNTPAALSAAAFAPSLLSAVGGQNRAQNQSNIDANLRAWLYNTNAPDQRLQNLYQMLGATPLGGYQTNSTSIGPNLIPGANGGTSTGQNVAAGVSGGLALYNIFKNLGWL